LASLICGCIGSEPARALRFTSPRLAENGDSTNAFVMVPKGSNFKICIRNVIRITRSGKYEALGCRDGQRKMVFNDD
jgi:hypothetical protein